MAAVKVALQAKADRIGQGLGMRQVMKRVAQLEKLQEATEDASDLKGRDSKGSGPNNYEEHIKLLLEIAGQICNLLARDAQIKPYGSPVHIKRYNEIQTFLKSCIEAENLKDLQQLQKEGCDSGILKRPDGDEYGRLFSSPAVPSAPKTAATPALPPSAAAAPPSSSSSSASSASASAQVPPRPQ